MNKHAIIAAGGSGTRMGNDTPKQFLGLNGKPLLWHSVAAFANTFPGIVITVVAPAAHLEAAKDICSSFPGITFTEGGATRFLSVKKGLATVKEPSIVFVHDAVRCLVTKQLVERCYEEALLHGSAIPCVPANDSIRMLKDNGSEVVDRSTLRIIQTPQTFRSDIILQAFDTPEKPSFTDEATVVEASGKTVHLIEGEYDNIKITRPFDLLIAEQILKHRSSL